MELKPTASRAHDIFNDALGLGAGERTRFLASACADDAVLRREVESLLDAHRAADTFLNAPAVGPTSDRAPSYEASLAPGATIGRYRIVDVIAGGGMGIVYRAVRADHQFEQRVAVKLARRGFSDAGAVRRFLQERQTLASLEHPYIARLIDGGRTEEGLTYLVMEYVDGSPIDRHCDEHRLDIGDRLRLFRLVCDAVSFAHQNLVVHRDLKPRNILVTPGGVPKLLDFGISRLLGDTTDPATGGTVLHAFTPAYAAPEQLRGEAVTTATDVYSLGVILHELLTGHRPRHTEHPPEVGETLVFDGREPLAPSAAISRLESGVARGDGENPRDDSEVAGRRGRTPAALRSCLRGDLDSIVLKALRRDPRHRYASVQQLSDDLGRFLDGLPVSARPSTLTYRAVRLVARNKGVTAVTLALAASLVVGIVGTSRGLWHARRAEQQAMVERDAARHAEAEAQAVTSFMQEILAAANPYRKGRNVTVVELLAEAEQRIPSEFADRPAVEAGVRFAIARTYAGMWHWPSVTPHLVRAIELQRRREADAANLAASLSLLGRSLTFARDPRSVEVETEALAIRRRLFGELHPLVAESTGNLGYALWAGVHPSRWADAEENYRSALAMYERLSVHDHPDVARFTFSLGVMLTIVERHAEAESLFREALAIYRRLPVTEDRYRIECLNHYAGLLVDLRRFDDAEAVLRESIERTPIGIAGAASTYAHWTLANVRRSRGDYAEAERLYRDILRDRMGTAGLEGPPGLDELAAMLADASAESERQGGTEHYRTVFASLARLAPGSPEVIEQIRNLAAFLCARRQHAAAEIGFATASRLMQASLDRDHWMIAAVRSDRAGCLIDLGAFAKAEALLARSVRTLMDSLGSEHRTTRLAIRRCVRLYIAWNRPEKADEYRAMLPREDLPTEIAGQ